MKPLFLLFCIFLGLLQNSAFAQADQSSTTTRLDNPTKVDDGDKGSSRISDMITGAEQAKKVVDVYEAGSKAVDVAKDPSAAYNKLKNAFSYDAMKDVLKAQIVQYKSTKGGFTKLLNDVLGKTSNILTAANRRVNMWRTTEPMLEYYGDRLKGVADNTIQVFSDFKPSDVVDIDRKWSRRAENALLRDKATFLSFNGFLQSRRGSLEDNERFFASLFFNNDIAKRLSKDGPGLKALLEMPEMSEQQKIPFLTLGYTTDAINGLRQITVMSHGASREDGSVTQENYNAQQIRIALEDPNQTYEDTKQLSVLISRRRAETALQAAQVEQIFAMLQTRYGRLLVRNIEAGGASFNDYNTSLNKILNGGAFKDLDEHRRLMFREASIDP